MTLPQKKRGKIMSNLRKILSLSLILALLGSASIPAYATGKTIPSTMPAGTILSYDEQLNPTITVDEQMQKTMKLFLFRMNYQLLLKE